MVKMEEKGITLVEVIVSMALISLISATVFISINFTTRTQAKNRIAQFFINETENVLICYFSDNFSQSLTFLTNNEVIIGEDDNTFTLYYDEKFSYTDEENSVFSLTIDYTDAFLPVVVCKNSNNSIIYSYGGEYA